MNKKSADRAYLELERGLYGKLPQLRGLALANEEDFTSLLIKHRGPMDWIVVAKKTGDDGGPLVCFGTGFDLVGALLGLEGTLASDRWRVDAPYNGKSST
jgi:hypothetical protein